MVWNDSEFPLAYLISFRSYGTWLHGDERGSTDRHNNEYGSAKYAGSDHWKLISSARMSREPVKLDAHRRGCVQKAIAETCEKRKWALHGLNVRTNHVHSVAAIGLKKPSIALNAFKANATRVMRDKGCWIHPLSPWSDKGSVRWLWTERQVSEAVDYVLNGQGDDLPAFE